MMDSGDVDRMGGQSAVYAFRNALSAGGAQAAAQSLLARNGAGRVSASASMVGGVAAGAGRTIEFTGPMYFPQGADHRALINHAIRESLR